MKVNHFKPKESPAHSLGSHTHNFLLLSHTHTHIYTHIYKTQNQAHTNMQIQRRRQETEKDLHEALHHRLRILHGDLSKTSPSPADSLNCQKKK